MHGSQVAYSPLCGSQNERSYTLRTAELNLAFIPGCSCAVRLQEGNMHKSEVAVGMASAMHQRNSMYRRRCRIHDMQKLSDASVHILLHFGILECAEALRKLGRSAMLFTPRIALTVPRHGVELERPLPAKILRCSKMTVDRRSEGGICNRHVELKAFTRTTTRKQISRISRT